MSQDQDPRPTLDELFEQAFTEFDASAVDRTVEPANAAEIVEETSLEGRKIALADLVDQEIVVMHVKPFMGEYGPALHVVGADPNGEIFNTTIGGDVLAPKIWRCRDRVPVKFKLLFIPKGQHDGYFDMG